MEERKNAVICDGAAETAAQSKGIERQGEARRRKGEQAQRAELQRHSKEKTFY